MNITKETHLKVAFCMWGLVGTGLLIAGSFFLFGRSLSVLNDGLSDPGLNEGIGLVIGLIIGFIKGNFVFKKLARKYIARIQSLPETSPIYMTFSGKSWIMILGMMALGRIIRALGAPPIVIGTIYIAVGFALVLGSRHYLSSHHTKEAGAST